MDDNTFDARIEQDAQGAITDWNAAAERLFGWTRAEALGRPSNMLIPLRNRERHDRSLHAVPAGHEGPLLSQRITAIHRDGHELLVEFEMSARQLDAGRRLVALAREIAVGQQMPSGLSLGAVRFDATPLLFVGRVILPHKAPGRGGALRWFPPKFAGGGGLRPAVTAPSPKAVRVNLPHKREASVTRHPPGRKPPRTPTAPRASSWPT